MKLLNFFLAMMCAAPLAFAEEALVQVHPLQSEDVDPGKITLRDVAQVIGLSQELSDKLNRLNVAQSFEEFAQLSPPELAIRLRDGIKEVEALCGCKVRLNLPGVLSDLATLPFSLQQVQTNITQALKKHCSECSFSVDKLRVQNGHVPQEYQKWQLAPNTRDWRGNTLISVYFDDKVHSPLVLAAEVRWKSPAYQLKKDKTSGSSLSSTEVQRVDQDITQVRRVLASLSDIQSSELRRSIGQGHLIYLDDLREKHSVQLGQPLSIEVSHGGFHLKMSGVAQKNGRVGDKIPVRVKNTHKDILAEVVGDGRVRFQR